MPEAAAAWLEEALQRLDSEPSALTELFPQLPRKVGRELLGGGQVATGSALVDLDAWRLCDAAALALLLRAGAEDEVLLDLYMHGDLEERAMVLRCLGVLPITDATIRLLEEVQRTNTVSHFEAALCETNLAARALEHKGFDEVAFNRLILKLAFMDLPLRRAFGAEQNANPELSRMLHALATERRAAGRTVWADTDQLIARAPIPPGPQTP